MNRADVMALIEHHLPKLRGVGHDVALQEGAHMDSFDYVTLIQILEDNFGIRVAADDMVDENFRSKDAIARFVEARYTTSREDAD